MQMLEHKSVVDFSQSSSTFLLILFVSYMRGDEKLIKIKTEKITTTSNRFLFDVYLVILKIPCKMIIGGSNFPPKILFKNSFLIH